MSVQSARKGFHHDEIAALGSLAADLKPTYGGNVIPLHG